MATQKNNTYIYAILILVLVLMMSVAIYVFAKKKKHEEADVAVADIKAVNAGGIVKPTTQQSSAQNLDLVLKKGVNSPEVATLQTILNLRITGTKLTVDGSFGQKTEDALMAARGVKETSLNQMNSYVAGLGGLMPSSGFSWF